MDCSLPGFSVHGIFQARVLECVVIAFSAGPITLWQIEGEKMEVVTNFLFLGSKIIVDGDCSHEIRRWLLLGRKAMTNLDSVLKSRDITLLTKVLIVKAMVFPVFMYSFESWTVKKAKSRRIDASNCGAGEDSWKSLWQQGDQTSQFLRKSVLNAHYVWVNSGRQGSLAYCSPWGCKELDMT